MIEIIRHYKAVASGGVEDKDIVPAAGEAYVVKGISYACPENGKSKCIVYWGGASLGDIYDASYNSKFVSLDGAVFEGDGVKTLKIRLDNGAAGTVAMGVTIQYENN